MISLCRPAAVLAIVSTVPGPAAACAIAAVLDLRDLLLADVIVTGVIRDYQVVPDLEAEQRYRAARRGVIESLGDDISPDLRATLESDGFLSDYARFRILVDQVLVGTVPPDITVTWDNSTFREPESLDESQRYLIALRRPGSDLPPPRGPSATILPTPEPNRLTVLQAPCAGPSCSRRVGRQARPPA